MLVRGRDMRHRQKICRAALVMRKNNLIRYETKLVSTANRRTEGPDDPRLFFGERILYWSLSPSLGKNTEN